MKLDIEDGHWSLVNCYVVDGLERVVHITETSDPVSPSCLVVLVVTLGVGTRSLLRTVEVSECGFLTRVNSRWTDYLKTP
jgi:hypothetical protein